MVQQAKNFNLSLRPHIKTHKTVKISDMSTNFTKNSLVCSSLKEATFLLEHGFTDILYGVPFGVDKLRFLSIIHQKYPNSNFSILIDNFEILEHLIHLNLPSLQVFLKVDCDNGRAGIFYNDPKAIVLAEKIDQNCIFKGLYAHCGNTYGNGGDAEVVLEIAHETASKVLALKNNLKPTKQPLIVGIGSTPTCSLMNLDHPKCQILKQLDEIHVGNFTLYDLMQSENIQSCDISEIAGFVLARVISVKHDFSRAIIDCGFTGISKQGMDNQRFRENCLICPRLEGTENSGNLLTKKNCSNQPSRDLNLTGMCQEHGTVTGQDVKNLKIGDIILILPWHSCVFSALHSEFYAVENLTPGLNSQVSEILPVCRGWV